MSEAAPLSRLIVPQLSRHAMPHRRQAAAVGDRADAADRLADRIRGLLRRSLHVRHLDAGSCNGCDWEIQALLGPVYDIQRLGIDVVASPRHADLLLVTGSVTRHLEQAALATYEAMPEPRLVIAVGACACGGGGPPGELLHRRRGGERPPRRHLHSGVSAPSPSADPRAPPGPGPDGAEAAPHGGGYAGSGLPARIVT
jgi:NADH ubiquinone oxidoreductase, 20 Kd subunit